MFLFALALLSPGSYAQTAAPSSVPSSSAPLSPELSRRVEILIRAKASIPPEYDVLIGPRTHSFVPGFDAISVSFRTEGKTSRPMEFLLSSDGGTVAQFNRFDISRDPKTMIDPGARPSRGGSPQAPVLIVGFDDLECPYCAKMHAQLFPALLERYKDQVRIVYRDFPLDEIHPWAMRAAVNVNCVGAHSATGYWNLVDYIHAHAGDLGGEEKSIAKANENLDKLSMDEGRKQHLDEKELKACIDKQDQAAIRQSVKEGEALGVNATPALFINGERLDGAVSLEYVYRMIDGALIAAGQTPPPPPAPAVPQPTPAASSAPAPSTPASKPGN